jgi:hypothetical protein
VLNYNWIGRQEVRGLEEELDKDSLLPILFNLYSEYLTKEDLEGFGDFKREGHAIHTLRCK